MEMFAAPAGSPATVIKTTQRLPRPGRRTFLLRCLFVCGSTHSLRAAEQRQHQHQQQQQHVHLLLQQQQQQQQQQAQQAQAQDVSRPLPSTTEKRWPGRSLRIRTFTTTNNQL
jgi:transcription initiation factor TFIID subunit TAF12